MWADVPDAAPIVAITNGVHVPTWQDPRVPAALESDDRPGGRPSGAEERSRGRDRAAHRRAARARRADRGLRAARGDLQAPRSRAPRRRADRAPPQGPAAPARLRRQGAPGRSRGQGHGDADRPDDPAVAGCRRVPGELRHGTGAAPDARRRRVAQHAAAAARGERHVGHEGRAERRAQLLHPRRLVARGLRARRDGLGHRRRRGRRGRRGPRRARSRVASPHHREPRCCPPTRTGRDGSP